jgi:DNA-binding response OmpR family regulator
VKKRVLIIENDLDIQNIVSYVLELEGYEVLAIKPCAAELVPRHRADVILLDEWINKREGHMLCTEIKEIKEIQHVPVIIFSTAVDIEAIAHVCKADGFVHKPFDIDALVNEVKRCCSQNFVMP